MSDGIRKDERVDFAHESNDNQINPYYEEQKAVDKLESRAYVK
jgi:hypothetical protein